MTPYKFATDKLLPVPEGKQGVVLVACGSFNPPTVLHMRMFEMAKDWFKDHPQYAVIGGYMSPVADAYGKKGLLSGDHRRAMCHRAVLEHAEVMVDEWESLKSEYTTTVNVLKHFSAELNKNNTSALPIKIALLCGGDMLASFNMPGVWADKDIEDIVNDFIVVCVQREGTQLNDVIFANQVLYSHRHNIILVPQWNVTDLSSTKVRQAIRNGLSIKYLCPVGVIEYLAQHKLYK
jgi:nicotinate (nicotinamide) nucleotide adenylyltransferase